MDIALQAAYKGTGKGSWSVERVNIATQMGTRVAKVATMQIREERTNGRRTGTGKEAKDKSKEATETAERVGRVQKQDTLQRGVHRKATKTCVPLKKTREKPLKKHVTMMKSCKRCVCWKEAIMSSDKR